jgi:hypothetical protein
MRSFSISIEDKPPSWGLTNTRQVKLWKVVEGNKEEYQTTTLTIHEIIDSRGIGFEGTKDGLKSFKDKKKEGLKHCQEIITKSDA